jgi:hypothetical protein
MKPNYLSVSIVVTAIGLALILFPQNIEMHIAPERVTVWEKTVTAEETLRGYMFTFDTGSQTIDDGMAPYVEVWSDDDVTLNTTFSLMESGTSTFDMNIMDNRVQFPLPGEDTYQVRIRGTVSEGQETEVYAGMYFLRPVPPEYYSYYPFRFFGYGMAAIGAIASLVFYMKREKETAP